MATIACPSCTRPVSTAAKTCPHCGRPTNAREHAKQLGQCRGCHAELRRDDHVQTVRYTEIVDGNSRTRSYKQARPCGQCGDPNPLGVVDTSKVGAWLILGFIAVLIIGFCLS